MIQKIVRHQSFITGMLFMLISAVGLAFTGLFGKLGLTKLPLTELVFWRYATSFLLCLALLWCLGELKGLSKMKKMKMHALRAAFVLLSQYSFYYYVERNSLLNAVVLLNLGPLVIPVIEWGVLRNKVGKSTWVGVIVSFIGVICVIQPDQGIFALTSLAGVLAGVSQGASQVIFGINSRDERSDLDVLYLFFLCALLSCIPYLFFDISWGVEGIIGSRTHHEWWGFSLLFLIIGLGAASLCNQITRAMAYQHSTPSRLSPFLYVSVLIAGLLDWAIYDKIPNVLSVIGACLVVLGGVLKIYLRARILKGKWP